MWGVLIDSFSMVPLLGWNHTKDSNWHGYSVREISPIVQHSRCEHEEVIVRRSAAVLVCRKTRDSLVRGVRPADVYLRTSKTSFPTMCLHDGKQMVNLVRFRLAVSQIFM